MASTKEYIEKLEVLLSQVESTQVPPDETHEIFYLNFIEKIRFTINRLKRIDKYIKELENDGVIAKHIFTQNDAFLFVMNDYYGLYEDDWENVFLDNALIDTEDLLGTSVTIREY